MGIFSSILDVLFPPRCVFCGKFLRNGTEEICPDCAESLPRLTGTDAITYGECFDICISALRYDGNVQKAIHRYKFRGAAGYADCFGKILAQCIKENLSGRYDIITWVPLSEERLKKRGYDQSFLLAQAAALALDDIAVETLVRDHDAKEQSLFKENADRRANVMGAYSASDAELIREKRILIIDDVVTTGSTLSECARTLVDAGASEVICAALCSALC